MARLLVRLTDEADPLGMSRGDVIDVREDGFDWVTTEMPIGWDWRDTEVYEVPPRGQAWRGAPDLWTHYGVFDFPNLTVLEGSFFVATPMTEDPTQPIINGRRSRVPIKKLDLDALPRAQAAQRAMRFAALNALAIAKPTITRRLLNGGGVVFGDSPTVFG